MKKEFSGVIIECISGDIAAQKDIAAVVNAANAELRTGGGVAGALHRVAGPELEVECRPLAPIKPGEAVITGGHSLPNDYVIHCLGPIFGVNKHEAKLLADCYRNSLRLAEEYEIVSLAFPSISTGVFGYPMDEAAEIAFRTVKKIIPELDKVKLIRFVLHGADALEIHLQQLQKIFG